MNKVERIIVGGIHLYNIIIEEVGEAVYYCLYQSDHSTWTIPDKYLIKVIDSGEGMVIERYHKGELDYSEAHELHILLSYIHKTRKIVDKLEIETVKRVEI